jgi:predicted transcriptional regulator
MVENLQKEGAHNLSGRLNYVLFALCQRYVPKNYTDLRNFLAEIHEAECEIRRRILGSLEDQKIQENGDVI